MASVHRARHLAKHLPSFGWHPIVVTVDEQYQKEHLDPLLGQLVPQHTEVHRVGAIPPWATSWFGVGDLSLRALVPLARKLNALIKIRRPEVVLISGAPYYQMLLAGYVRGRGPRVVLDFQDPWVSAEGATRPKWSKAGLAHRLAVGLEPRPVRRADLITSVSEIQNKQMARRYPWLDHSRMAAIPIGGDPDDYDALRANPPDQMQIELPPDRIHLSYVGTFLPRAGQLMQVLFRAVQALKLSDLSLASRLRFNFVGTSNQPNDVASFRVRPLAEEAGVADLVHELPQRIPYLQALAVLARSTGLLLIGSDERHYTASKIYPALMSGRPFLSLFHGASSAHAILRAAGGGRAFAFESPDELEGLTPSIAAALRDLALNPDEMGQADPAAYAPYTAKAVTRQFAELFDGLVSERADASHAGRSGARHRSPARELDGQRA